MKPHLFTLIILTLTIATSTASAGSRPTELEDNSVYAVTDIDGTRITVRNLVFLPRNGSHNQAATRTLAVRYGNVHIDLPMKAVSFVERYSGGTGVKWEITLNTGRQLRVVPLVNGEFEATAQIDAGLEGNLSLGLQHVQSIERLDSPSQL